MSTKKLAEQGEPGAKASDAVAKTSTPIAESQTFPVLDGIRSVMTIWVVSFHTLWFLGGFSTEKDFTPFYYQPSFTILNSGLVAVDIFFLMTGFLLAYPIFAGQRPGSWGSFVWRRITRLYPSYVFALAFVCLGVYRMAKDPVITWDQHPSTGIRELVVEAGKDPGMGIPNNCELSIFNLLFLNNYLPFGGCMGWTWSLCVQVHFILIFPLALRWLGSGKKLMYAIVIGNVINIVFRYFLYAKLVLDYTPSKMYMFNFEDRSMYFIFFNIWYAPTHMRIGGVFMGVALAYVQYHYGARCAQWAKNNLFMGTIVTTLLTVISYPAIWYTFHMPEYEPHFMAIFTVGGPLWQLTCAFHMFSLVNKIGFVHSVLARVLSIRLFAWLALPSYAVYLVHQALIPKIYSLLFYPLWPGFNEWRLFQATCVVIAAAWTFGFICHYVVEEPFKSYLRGSSKPKSSDSEVKAKAQ